LSAWKPSGGSMSDMLAAKEERERRRREEEAKQEPAANLNPQTLEPAPDLSETPPAVAPERYRSAASLKTAAIMVPARKGFTAVPNTILDELLKRLHPNAQLVYLRLYRLARIKERGSCVVGYKAICEATNLPRSSVQRALGQLEALGLISREPGERAARGALLANRYTVREPVEEPAASDRSAANLRPASDRMTSEKNSPENMLTPEEVAAINEAAAHERAMDRVPGHRDAMRRAFGDVMPWERGYVPLARRR
jgi:hypothetical protein